MEKTINPSTMTINRKTTTIVYMVTALILSSVAICFIAASQDYVQIFQSASSQNISASKDALADLIGTTNKMIFYIAVGIAYIPVALWTTRTTHHSKLPYIVAIIGSAALIVFYVATRVIALPNIGLQTDVGSIDITCKLSKARYLQVH
jgi:hypothetical protein